MFLHRTPVFCVLFSLRFYFTVSFAALEVVLPLAFVTTQRNCRLFSDAVAVKLKVAVSYPADLQFVQVLAT